ncbi:MAG TPA: hypothetical protein VNF45_05945 [Candidatus Binataceae bacterium]|nr:hypothetical protein [Candidatus Binataceae bacterium]
MEIREEQLIREYSSNDNELRDLYAEHLVLKRQLESLRSQHHLSTEDELEIKRIQKLKLAQKDRMMDLIRRHQHNGH